LGCRLPWVAAHQDDHHRNHPNLERQNLSHTPSKIGEDAPKGRREGEHQSTQFGAQADQGFTAQAGKHLEIVGAGAARRCGRFGYLSPCAGIADVVICSLVLGSLG
jgi:hypothetical protein